MALTARLELRQSQALVMTPQLMQAIKLLQLSNLELSAFVEAELERNPLLERAADEGDAAERDLSGSAPDDDEEASLDRGEWQAPDTPSLASVMDHPPGAAERDDLAWNSEGALVDPDVFLGNDWHEVRPRRGFSEDVPSAPGEKEALPSLQAHLTAQLRLAFKDPLSRHIGAALIDRLDEAGYLRADPDRLAEELGVAPAHLAHVLTLLKTFEPTGVFARDLAECLGLQLAERDRLDPAMRIMLAHLDLVAKRDHARLKRLCGVDEEDIREMITEIAALNPRPGSAYGGDPPSPVIPDIIVRQRGSGEWMIELNPATLPRVLVNQDYYQLIARGSQKPEEKTYVTDCLQTANWLVKSLEQRARTLLKVTAEILRQQDAFFARGIAHLRPLTLRAVAEAIGMHESTISRATSNKTMATPRGLFDLKYFFTAPIASVEGGEAHSAEAVRHRIRHLIGAESAHDVLSDDTLVEKLGAEGITIARRTVAKYREAMGIPSSVERRRQKARALSL